ncbi:MAG: HAD-IC family P-type ATPase [Chloroflexi bacterium]|nr:HAD-IC family P-type ATPase [Chloroflexota bacterium]
MKQHWHIITAKQTLEELKSGPGGLSSAEAVARLAYYGPNSIESGKQINPWAILLHQFTSPLIYILLLAMVITMAIQHWSDAIVIGAIVILNAVIGFTQENRAENAMQALMRLISPKAEVLRDGHERQVESSTLVPGDIVLLQSGSLVPADLRLVRGVRLETEEALLTGESFPVRKDTAPLSGNGSLPIGDRRNMAFMGTIVSSGRGLGVVVATGSGTQVGSIARAMRRTTRAPTPLQGRMAGFSRWVTIIIVCASVLAFALGLSIGESPTEMFLTAVALAVAAIPEGLPIAMTVALAVSIRRMARRNAIVRRLAAVETLGSCTVIVSDKTGTLTENQMTVQAVFAGGSHYTVTGPGHSLEGGILRDGRPVDMARDAPPLHLTLQAGLLANEASIDRTDGGFTARGDPTEVALLVAAAKAGLSSGDLLSRYPKMAEVPFEPERQFAATVHRDGDGDRRVVFLKGAPERVLDMCDSWLMPDGLRPLDRDAVIVEARRMAEQGLRVLAMATGAGEQASKTTLDGTPTGLAFLGLQGMMDPPRPEVIRSIAACKRAGIRVLMVTGDHAVTAVSIARMVGLADTIEQVVTGRDLDSMSDAELDQALRRVAVFARASPTQKLRIVNALRRAGHVIAVTGDGVNDAPALKAAHIGAAMGRSGTDVAKEASDIVLTDDNFATIYAAVEEGRVAFSNIRKVTFFLISAGAGQVIAILASLALRMPLPFLPAQLLWMNLVTNGVQDVALAFEPGETGLYRRPPRRSREGIISWTLVERTVLVGLLLAAGTLGIYAWERAEDVTLSYARVAALTTAIMFQFFHVGNCRSEDLSLFKKDPFSNRFLFLGAVIALAVHIGAMYFDPTQALLKLEPLTALTWTRLILVSFTIILVVELHKLLRHPRAT